MVRIVLKSRQRKYSKAKGRYGFTFLEVLVAMSIISIALIAVFRLYTQTISINYQLAFNTRAPFLAQQKMNQWMTMPADEMGDGSGGFEDDFSEYSWVVTVEDVVLESLASQILKRIDIRVAMPESGQNYNLRSYRFPRD